MKISSDDVHSTYSHLIPQLMHFFVQNHMLFKLFEFNNLTYFVFELIEKNFIFKLSSYVYVPVLFLITLDRFDP